MIKTKVLIVDDYRENAIGLRDLIAAPDIEIFIAMNAQEALELITQNDFGLALLDVHMPGINGFELARLIRGVKRYRHLPIIFVTAHQHDQAVIFEGYETGAVDLLFKPIEPSVVRSKVRIFVELYQQRILLQNHVQELERLRLAAESAAISKSQFLANMSHEIRTPLAAVLGFSEMLAKGMGVPSKRAEWAESVKRNGALLLKLIDDILDFSKIEANRIELEKARIDLLEVLNDVETTLTLKAQEKGITLEFRKPEQVSSHYMADPMRFKQILLNVIGNAIKFTVKGKIQVDVAVFEGRGNQHGKPKDQIFIQVRDEGVGISEDQARRLFQPFSQADASTRRQFGGSGLGLTISREIAHAMGGDIRLVSSTPSRGSVFEITVLFERTASVRNHKTDDSDIAAPEQVNLRGKNILVVDDSPDNLELVKVYLEPSQPKLSFAESGAEAIEKVKNQPFDLILMDLQMPGMDGHEATYIIRRLGFVKPIIALTAHALKAEHDRCLAAGCDEVVVKPIRVGRLLRVLERRLLRPSLNTRTMD